MNSGRTLWILFALVLAIGMGFALGRLGSGSDAVVAADAAPAIDGISSGEPAGAGGDSPPQAISRTILRTVDDPASPTHEVVMGVAEIPAGASSGTHIHPGIEVGYILDGTLVLHHEGREPETLSVGDSFHNDAPHDAINASDRPVRILAVWIVEKGKPMSEPVP
jgi:quercetin dioxygenase-like cupin family protein